LPERFVLVPPDLVTIFAVAAAQPARPGRRGDRGARWLPAREDFRSL